MNRRLRAAADHERQTGRAIGTKRTATIGSMKKEPDVGQICARGHRVQGECKVTARPPSIITKGLRQARGYNPGAHPIVVVRGPGGAVFVAMELALFQLLADVPGDELPKTHTPTPKNPKQTELFT